MKAIIVDDEPRAIELLKDYLRHFNTIDVVATFRNGLKAFEFLSSQKVDLVLLDINMPHISGISLSKMISPDTKIIFTTAYAEYAVESYEVEAADYLLKPISFERFAKAITKLMSNEVSTKPGTTDYPVIVKSGTKLYRIKPEDILYLQKDGNYMTYTLRDRQILARESIQEALDKLPDFFLQTHKSYIVNSASVNSLDKDQIDIEGKLIPLGPAYKERVSAYLFNKK